MDPNREMTGEPNQQNRPSVFAFDPYQQQNLDVDGWAKLQASQGVCSGLPLQSAPSNPQFANLGDQFAPQLREQIPPQQNFLGNYIPPSAQPIANDYGVPGPIPGSFSFGPSESKPATFPVQFPFPANAQKDMKGLGTRPGPSGLTVVPPKPGKSSYGSRLAEGSFFINANTEMNITSRSSSSSCDMSEDIFFPIRGKRKNKDPPLRPSKQHITEEIMAEHMSNLHISSESDVPYETETRREKRLYMCAEMRKLQNESIIPEALLSKMNRPCTALVLWTPPPRIFPPLQGSTSSETIKHDDDNNREAGSSQMDNEPLLDEITIEGEGVSSAVATEMDYDL